MWPTKTHVAFLGMPDSAKTMARNNKRNCGKLMDTVRRKGVGSIVLIPYHDGMLRGEKLN